jgi:polysaccharide biosynthesis/export protein
MTAVSRWVRALIGIAAFACIALPFTARAQESQSDEFHVGDRIALTVDNPLPGTQQGIRDTLTVRDGLILTLAGLGDVHLAGVKRADIQKYLTQEIGKFIRDPVVHATALVRIAVLGQVNKPGFYTVPSDMLISDLVMSAGGPTGTADLNRSVIKRGSTDVIPKEQLASALASGMTIDQMHVAPGDALVIGQKPGSSWDTILKVIGVAASVGTLLFYLKR